MTFFSYSYTEMTTHAQSPPPPPTHTHAILRRFAFHSAESRNPFVGVVISVVRTRRSIYILYYTHEPRREREEYRIYRESGTPRPPRSPRTNVYNINNNNNYYCYRHNLYRYNHNNNNNMWVSLVSDTPSRRAESKHIISEILLELLSINYGVEVDFDFCSGYLSAPYLSVYASIGIPTLACIIVILLLIFTHSYNYSTQ